MFTLLTVKRRRPDGSFWDSELCAVDFSIGAVINFGNVSSAAELAVRRFNSGASDAGEYNQWPMSECVDAATGQDLRPAVLDPAPEGAIVNVLGLDYVVPREVANHVAELRRAVFSLSTRPEKEREAREAATDARWTGGVEASAKHPDCHEND